MIYRIIAALLPAGALFIPLGTLNLRILFSRTEFKLTLPELIRLAGNFGENELLGKLVQGDLFAAALPWVYAAVAGLVVCILAILAGAALSFTKADLASICVYGAGLLGAIVMAVGFSAFGKALEGNLLFTADAAVGAGSYLLMALFPLAAGVCLLRRWEFIK